MSKAKSILKKINTFATKGLGGIDEGVNNFHSRREDVEEKAKERSSVCASCPLRVPEPIDFLAVEDDANPLISGMMCEDCGCVLPFLVRQDSKICSKW